MNSLSTATECYAHLGTNLHEALESTTETNQLQKDLGLATKPGIVFITGGTADGKTTVLNTLKNTFEGKVQHVIDAFSLADAALDGDHGNDTTDGIGSDGVGRLHEHPQEVYESHKVEEVYDAQGQKIGHKHNREFANSLDHFPFDTTYGNFDEDQAKNFIAETLGMEFTELEGHPLIILAYANMFNGLIDQVQQGLEEDVFVEMAGGVNLLGEQEDEALKHHPMAKLNLSYGHLLDILMITLRARAIDPEEFTTHIKAAINVVVPDLNERLRRTEARLAPGEERTPALVYAYGINDFEEHFAGHFPKAKVLHVDNSKTFETDAERTASVMQQLRAQA